MSNDLANLINGPTDERIMSKVSDQNNRSQGTKSRNPKTHKCQSFNQHGHLPRHVQSCQLKCNRKENEKPVHPPSPVTSCSSGSLTDADTERSQFHIKILLLLILLPGDLLF
ncbi:16091_t:CDS:2, partial [Rhizophagus irregularis]